MDNQPAAPAEPERPFVHIGERLFFIDLATRGLANNLHFRLMNQAKEQQRQEAASRRQRKDPTALESIVDKLKGLPLELQKVAVQEAVRLDHAEPEVDKALLMMQPANVAYLLWQVTRTHHSADSLADLQKLITEENAGHVLADVVRASNLQALQE